MPKGSIVTRQRKDGTIVYRVRYDAQEHGERKQLCETVSTMEEAEALLDLRLGERRTKSPTVAVAEPEVMPPLDDLPSWREFNVITQQMQTLRRRSSRSRNHLEVRLDVEEPICLMALGDTHIGSIATDHGLLESITDEILSTPNLYVVLLGDILDMAVKLRGVAEVQGSVLPSELQYVYAASWLAEIAPRVLCATWGNHDVDREEALLGSSRLAAIYADKNVAYSNGIAHVDLILGEATYPLALSHTFRGRSIYNPVHGAQRYATLTPSRSIVMAGDSHVPGLLTWNHDQQRKIAINSGTLQTHSGYARRYFSLFTDVSMPCVALWPDEYRAVPFFSLGDWRACMGESNAA